MKDIIYYCLLYFVLLIIIIFINIYKYNTIDLHISSYVRNKDLQQKNKRNFNEKIYCLLTMLGILFLLQGTSLLLIKKDWTIAISYTVIGMILLVKYFVYFMYSMFHHLFLKKKNILFIAQGFMSLSSQFSFIISFNIAIVILFMLFLIILY